ncbi:hypothetical protein BJ742DRAFT_836935 [Cladochytrium replicatum]|nr:hypothetical protein BJ742DRAFT_836935 [Cladochytrium replicatum]
MKTNWGRTADVVHFTALALALAKRSGFVLSRIPSSGTLYLLLLFDTLKRLLSHSSRTLRNLATVLGPRSIALALLFIPASALFLSFSRKKASAKRPLPTQNKEVSQPEEPGSTESVQEKCLDLNSPPPLTSSPASSIISISSDTTLPTSSSPVSNLCFLTEEADLLANTIIDKLQTTKLTKHTLAPTTMSSSNNISWEINEDAHHSSATAQTPLWGSSFNLPGYHDRPLSRTSHSTTSSPPPFDPVPNGVYLSGEDFYETNSCRCSSKRAHVGKVQLSEEDYVEREFVLDLAGAFHDEPIGKRKKSIVQGVTPEFVEVRGAIRKA